MNDEKIKKIVQETVKREGHALLVGSDELRNDKRIVSETIIKKVKLRCKQFKKIKHDDEFIDVAKIECIQVLYCF